MRKNIFDMEIRVDILAEFKKIVNLVFMPGTIKYDRKEYSYAEFIDEQVFIKWKYRDTCLDSLEYLYNLEIDEQCFKYGIIDETKFLYYIEFLLNMNLMIRNNYSLSSAEILSNKLASLFKHNFNIILEKMNYRQIQDGDKIIIVKRDADVDSVIELVPENIAMLLLEYNDIRNNNLESKVTILKKIDKYIEEDCNRYKQNCSKAYNASQFIVNKLGINHPNKTMTVNRDDLINWYDKCFRLFIHLIRNSEIQEIVKETNELK